MGIISKLFKAIFSAIKKLVSMVFKLIKKIWPILLVFAAIYFAPAIGGFVTSAGGPQWLSTAIGWVSTNLTPYATSAVSWLTSGAGSLWSSAEEAWAGMTLGTKASLALGSLALLAPEETEELISEVATTVVDATSTIGGAILSGASSSPLVWVMGGLLVLWALSSNDKES